MEAFINGTPCKISSNGQAHNSPSFRLILRGMFDDEYIRIVELMVTEILVEWILVMRMELSVGKLEESVPLPTSLEPIEVVLGGTSQRVLLKKQKTRNNGKPPKRSILHLHLPCIESCADHCCFTLENSQSFVGRA
jgi:hypothetical protein